jgi:nitric oxide reductase subunit C
LESPAIRALVVVAGYVAITAVIFVSPTRSEPPPDVTAQVAAGTAVWRQNNCESCHSVYGLGGHIGPDLTNIIKWRGPAYVQGMLLAGRPGMPSFAHLPAEDMTNLLAYLTFVNGTGEFPQHTRPLKPFGNVP